MTTTFDSGIGLGSSETPLLATIVVLGEPKPTFYRKSRSGRIYRPQIDFIQSAKWDVLAQTQKQIPDYRNPTAGSVYVDYYFGIPIPDSWPKRKKKEALEKKIYPGKPDYDNLKKTYNDIIKGIVIKDDSQIIGGKWVKEYTNEPKVIIWIYKYGHKNTN